MDALIDEMIDNHAGFIRGFGELLRKAYAQGRSDQRMGIPDESIEEVKRIESKPL